MNAASLPKVKMTLLRLRKVILVATPIILFTLNAALALKLVHAEYFVSVSPFHFVALIWSAAAGLVAGVAAAAPVYRAARSLLRGKPSPDKRPPIDDTIVFLARRVAASLQRPYVSGSSSVALVVTAALFIFFPKPVPPASSSSGVLAITIGDKAIGTDKFIYVAEPSAGQIGRFRSSDLNHEQNTIPIGSQGNLGERGTPESLIELSRDNLDVVFVTDTKHGMVDVLDIRRTFDIVVAYGLSAGPAPRSMAITPDHRKLFVSHEQTIPNGYISVVDISGDQPRDFHEISRIVGVNCPEGLVLSSTGDRLFVATQCGGGRDPVMVIDTAANAVISSIPNLAVGTSVAISRDSRRLYVGRGNYPCASLVSKEPGSPFSVIDVKSEKVINTICLRTSVGAIALSCDANQRYLVVANGSWLSVLDREKLDQPATSLTGIMLNDINLEANVSSVAVADDNSVYAFIPATPRLFLYSPVGLLPGVGGCL